MKKVFVVTMLLVFAVLSVFAIPTELSRNSYDSKIKLPYDKDVTTNATKDSLAIATGAKGVLQLGDYKCMTPTALTSIVVSPTGDTIQVAGAKWTGTNIIEGLFYSVSLDGGSSFSVPYLVSGAGPYMRMYYSLETNQDQYPYITVGYRTATMMGTWFVVDGAGPAGGGWTAPLYISDTVDYATYFPSIAVNPVGDKITFIADEWNVPGFGINNSVDYGTSWAGFSVPSNLSVDTLYSTEFTSVNDAKLSWGQNDDVYALLNLTFVEDTVRWDAYSYAYPISFGLSKSTDGGATWSDPVRPFSGLSLPAIPSINGDTFIYYIDTLENGVVDSLPVKAYFDEATGYWADEAGNITAADAIGFGTGWNVFDAEYYANPGLYIISAPMNDVFVDYYADTMLHTFIDWGMSIMFGYQREGDANVTWDYINVHDYNAILDADGNRSNFRGYVGYTNIAYDNSNGDIYIIYADYPDTINDGQYLISSTEVVRINNYIVERATIIPHDGSGVLEAADIIDENGFAHIAMCANSYDSLYYLGVDVKDAGLVWDTVCVSTYAGINTSGRIIANSDNNLFNLPSLVKSDSKISFTLQSNSEVNISLYDVTGRMVKTLASGSFTKGTHTVNMNSNNYSQGVYFVKVNAGDQSVSKKVIVVK